MTTAGLQKKIAEVLGVSSSEKELAFEIFILKVCEILTEDVTLKVQRIGFFQLKKNIDVKTCTLLFIPLSEDLYRESKNLFLTIPIPSHYHKEQDLDPDVFSIGVGKPILPLSGSDTNNTETSYAILRKSIEERVNEILAGSDQLPNFNIWDDYYKSVKYVDHPAKDKMNDLNADAEFKEEFMAEDLTKNLLELASDNGNEDDHIKETLPREVSLNDLLDGYNVNVEDKPTEEEPDLAFTDEDIDFEEPTNEINFNEENLHIDEGSESDDLEDALQKVIDDVEKNIDNPSPELTEQVKEEYFVEAESAEHKEEDNKIDEVEEYPKEINNVTVQQTGEENVLDEKEIIDEQKHDEIKEIISNLAARQEEKIETTEKSYFTEEEQLDDSLEIEVPTKSKDTLYEITHESKLDGVDLDKVNDEDNGTNYYLGLKRKDDEPVEWDWGDELKEEFGVEFLKEEQMQSAEDNNDKPPEKDEVETVDDIFKTTQHVKSTLFDELEDTVKKEIEEAEEPHQVLEYTGEPRRFHFIEEQQVVPDEEGTKPSYPPGTRFESTDEIMEEFNNEKGFSFGKTFLLIFSSFVVVVAFIIYLLMSNKEQPETKIPSITEADSISSQQQVITSEDSSQIYSDEFSDFPKVASLPAKDGSEKLKPETNLNAASNESVVQPNMTKPNSDNNELYRLPGTDTRIIKNIYFDGREYNFQVSSWRNRIKAEQEVQRLRNKGYTAYVIEAFLPEKGGTWFRVRVGSFKSKEAAEQFSTNNTF